MEDIAKLFGDHREDLENWFDTEVSRLKIVKGQRLGFYDDLARRVLGQGLMMARVDSIRSLELADSPEPYHPTVAIPKAASLTPPVPPLSPIPSARKWSDIDDHMHLPGAVFENGHPKSADSGDSLVLLQQQQDHSHEIRRFIPTSIEEANMAPGPAETMSSMHNHNHPIPLLYGMDRGSWSKSASKQRKPRVGYFRQLSRAQGTQQILTTFTTSPCFKTLCGGVIILNALFMGIAANNMLASAMSGKDDIDMVFEAIEIGFCMFFLVELLLRLMAERWAFFKTRNDGYWNIFDIALVGLSLIDVALTLFQAGKALNLTFARVMRLFRFVRILRIVRVMRFFHSFRLIIYSVLYSIICLLWVFGMLVFIMYFFAMFFVHGISEHFRTYHEDNDGAICDTALCLEIQRLCGNVVNMVLSLFMSICGGIDWRELWVILTDVSWVYGCAFVFYIFFMAFGVLNVVVATFVEQSSLISRRDRELVTQNELEKNRQYYSNIRRFFVEADIDSSGSLSWREFEDYLADENVQAYFQSFELDVTQARTLFRLLDLDDSDDVDIDEFVEGCMRMRGQARSIDVHMLLYENEKLIRRNVEFMHHVEDQLHSIRNDQTKETRHSVISNGMQPDECR